MPKRHQNRQAKEQAGRNYPTKSTVITTGTPRKRETLREEARDRLMTLQMIYGQTIWRARIMAMVLHLKLGSAHLM